jgi:hypothetical protein
MARMLNRPCRRRCRGGREKANGGRIAGFLSGGPTVDLFVNVDKWVVRLDNWGLEQTGHE